MFPERECRTDVLGTRYLGVQNTALAEPCVPWVNTSASYDIRTYFVEGTAERAGNYCRNPDASLYGPYCYVGEYRRRVTCDIEFCGEIQKFKLLFQSLK